MKGKTKSTLLSHTIQVKVTQSEYEAMKTEALDMDRSLSDAARVVLTEHLDRHVVVLTVWPQTARALGLIGGKEVEYLGDTLVSFKLPAKQAGVRIVQLGVTLYFTKFREEISGIDVMTGGDEENSWVMLPAGMETAKIEIEKYGVLAEAK